MLQSKGQGRNKHKSSLVMEIGTIVICLCQIKRKQLLVPREKIIYSLFLLKEILFLVEIKINMFCGSKFSYTIYIRRC